MSETTNLRQADAKVDVVGIVSENKLEEVVKDGKKSIRGDLVVQTGDINFITFNVFVNEKKEDGTDNKTYAGVKTVMEEYDSIAKVGKDAATRVVISDRYGQISPSSYIDKGTGQARTTIRYRSAIFSRYRGTEEEFDPHAWFEIEMSIVSVAAEVYTSGENTGDETGRVIVKGWMPTYSGIEPMTLVAPAEDGIAEAIMDDYLPGQTVKFYGDIVNSRATIEETIPVKIGKPRTKVKTIYKNELIITNASGVYGEEDGTPEPYDIDAIKKAVADRDLRLDEEKKKAKKPETTAAKPKVNRGLPTF